VIDRIIQGSVKNRFFVVIVTAIVMVRRIETASLNGGRRHGG
jgi:Cu/Ag efflux pump CusA